MIAVDTNVVVTLLVREDDPAHDRVKELCVQSFIYIAPTVLLEAEWVIRSRYKWLRPHVLRALADLLAMPNVQTEIWAGKAIAWASSGLDLADALHFAGSESAESFYTFDRDLIRKGRALDGGLSFFEAPDL